MKLAVYYKFERLWTFANVFLILIAEAALWYDVVFIKLISLFSILELILIFFFVHNSCLPSFSIIHSSDRSLLFCLLSLLLQFLDFLVDVLLDSLHLRIGLQVESVNVVPEISLLHAGGLPDPVKADRLFQSHYLPKQSRWHFLALVFCLPQLLLHFDLAS